MSALWGTIGFLCPGRWQVMADPAEDNHLSEKQPNNEALGGSSGATPANVLAAEHEVEHDHDQVATESAELALPQRA